MERSDTYRRLSNLRAALLTNRSIANMRLDYEASAGWTTYGTFLAAAPERVKMSGGQLP